MDEAARTPTDDVLIQMLRENTGVHFLDSGGDSGRHFQRNARRDLEHEPESVVSFRYGSISVEHRVYHWMRERLDVDEEATEAFDGPFLAEVDPDDDKDWGTLREEFPAWFARWKSRRDGTEDCPTCDGGEDRCEDCGGTGTLTGDDSTYSATGIYGEGDPLTVNTYNEENLLDQVLLFTYFEVRTGPGRGGNHGSYVVLQVHGGCDARGGYSRPRVFTVNDPDDLTIFDYRRGTIFCTGKGPFARDRRQLDLPTVAGDSPDHYWTTDDGCHWYREGACGRGAGTQLETYERVTVIGCDEDLVEGTTQEWVAGSLCVLDTGDGFCPVCGGLLQASSR